MQKKYTNKSSRGSNMQSASLQLYRTNDVYLKKGATCLLFSLLLLFVYFLHYCPYLLPSHVNSYTSSVACIQLVLLEFIGWNHGQ